MSNTSIEAYFSKCQSADWYFQFSDDNAMWRRGKEQIEAIKAEASTSPMHQAIFDAWGEYIASTINGPAIDVPTLASITIKEEKVAHTSPCKDSTCIDLECQVRASLRQYLLLNVAEQDRPMWTEACLTVLKRLLNDSAHGHQDPFFFVEATLEGAQVIVGDRQASKAMSLLNDTPHVQVEKPVLEAPAKVVRSKRTTKHKPRVTDGVKHPVTVTTKDTVVPQQQRTIAISEDVLEATLDRMANERVERILAAKQAPAGEVYTQVLGNTSVMFVAKDGANERETAGKVLPAFVVDKSLTVPALDLVDESMDLVAATSVRSAYNKARFRLENNSQTLPNDTTYRTLVAEHARLMTVAQIKASQKGKQVAVVIDTERAAKVQALVATLGWTQEKAEAAVDALA